MQATSCATLSPARRASWCRTKILVCVAGGDGPKAHVLEHMVKQHSLQDRVRLVGAVSHAAVRSFLVQVTSHHAA